MNMAAIKAYQLSRSMVLILKKQSYFGMMIE